jgi:hypothetical protein
MRFRDKVGRYFHFTMGFREYLRSPLPADLEGLIRRQLEGREGRLCQRGPKETCEAVLLKGLLKKGPAPI